MAKARLTDAGVRGLTTDRRQEDVWDELVPGLCCRVSGTTGRKTWYVRYRANGTHRRLKLGTYPGMTLAAARTEARDVQVRADAGEDPAPERRNGSAPGAEEEPSTTFKALAREVLEAKASKTRQATRDERRRILERELLPAWGKREAASITRRDVVTLVEEIAKRGAPVMANRTLALVRLIYNTGLRRGFPTLESSPAHMVEPPGEEAGRGRYLDRDEIRTVWRATEPENPETKAIFRLTLLTAQRVGSVCALRWADIDDADVWTIPEAMFKGKRHHAVPLSAEARAVLDDMRPLTGSSAYVFPGRSDGGPHVSSTNSALRRIRKRSGLRHWTLHDMRRTFRTWATRAAEPTNPKDPTGLGVAPHVADAVLGHKEASLGFARYTGDAHRYLLAEKREALARWGAFVREAVEAEDDGS